MSILKVNKIRHTASDTDVIDIANDGTCTANITNNLSNRNIIINGAMQVAQRATSSTSSGIATVDRFGVSVSGTDESPTQGQADVASGTTPYELGFRKSYKITNGNQTSGAGTGDRILVYQNIEAQNMAQSGWNYTSPSSFITLSFWAKSSVPQTFYVALTTEDGTSQRYGVAMTFTSTNWTKFTYKIPGNSNLTFDDNVDRGFQIFWTLFRGTDTTDNSFVLNQWAAYNSSIRYPDITSTWYTTNDATFELTGVQLEVSDHATDFEHKSFAQDLTLCHRYCIVSHRYDTADGYSGVALHYSGTQISGGNWIWCSASFPVVMRSTPSLDTSDGAGNTGNKHTIWTSTGGSVTHDVSNYHTSIFKDHFTISNYWETKYGMRIGGYKAEAEL